MATNASEELPSGNRKRKRQERLQQYGIDLPDIPGVPVEVIPLLVFALKAATKFFQNEASVAYNKEWDGRRVESKNLLLELSKPPGALDVVLNQMDAASQDSSEKQQQNQREVKMKDAAQSWLQTVKRFGREAWFQGKDGYQVSNSSEIPSSAEKKDESSKKSVPLSCFFYIWSLGREHKRVAVRRAALYLKRHLLDKSSECRAFFLQESDHLWQWLQMLANGDRKFDKTKQRLWQLEGHKLLLQLISKKYADQYPKLVVSEQWLRQAISLEASDQSHECLGGESGSTRNMTILRSLRGIALKHGNEEIRRVEKLIQRCQTCMDILVPRIDDSTRNKPVGVFNETSSQTEVIGFLDNGEGEDDVDWVDEWEEEDEDFSEPSTGKETHALAVERTLQAMEAMGGFKGTMEINLCFNTGNDGLNEGQSALTNDVQTARNRFSKCARFLAERHLPRMRAWLEGLVKADRLHQPPGGSSLLLMSPQQENDREELRRRLNDVKEKVLIVLRSAAQLKLLVVIEGSSN